MKKALLYFFAVVAIQFVMSWIVFAAWIMATGGSVADVLSTFKGEKAMPQDAYMLIATMIVYGLAAMFLFVKFKWVVLSPAYLRTRPWGVFAWSAVAALGSVIPSNWLQEQLPPLPDTAADAFKLIIGNDLGYLTICLLAPLVEEVVFRGAILRALLSSLKNHWAAIFVSAVLFAIVHVNPAQMPHAFLVGLLLGWMYYRTGSVLPGVALHWVNNTVAYVFCLLYPSMADATLSEFFGGNHRAEVLSVVFSLFILLPAIYQLNARMTGADKR